MASASEKLQRVGVATNLKFAVGFLITGIIFLILSIVNFNKISISISVIMILVSVGLIIFGAWGTKKMWRRV